METLCNGVWEKGFGKVSWRVIAESKLDGCKKEHPRERRMREGHSKQKL